MGVSIITAARNAAGTIRETLDSVVGQDYEAWELIVIDDGSTDLTAGIVQEAAARDARIRLVRAGAGGVSRARNLGVAESRYELILFLDADDLLAAGHLSRLTAHLVQNPSIGAAYSDSEVATESGSSRIQSTFRQSGDLFCIFARTCAFAIHSCVVRRDLVRRAGEFDESLPVGEDWDLWQRIARTGTRFEHVPGPAVRVRVRTASASSRVRDLFFGGRRVIEQGHRPDDRVIGADARHASGCPAEELDEAKLLFALYCAG